MDKRIEPIRENAVYFVKWTVLSAVIGVVVGLIGAVFGHGVVLVTKLWQARPWMVFLAPVSGVIIVGLYQLAKEQNNKGTDMVLESISGDVDVTPATAPLIFASTILSHAVSMSIGREGAALQLGGSLGSMIGRLVRLSAQEKKIAVMCGMSACFAALFGTPLAAGMFALEMVCVGVMYYAGLIPCLFSAFIGAAIAGRMGLAAEHYEIGLFPAFDLKGAVMAVALAAVCALVSILFCHVLHESIHLYKKYFANPYLRVAAGSVIYIVLTLIFSDRLYNGSGLQLIEHCFEGEAVPYYAFLVKLLFTAVALGAGFKGGEIVPALSVGAAVGCGFARLFGLPVGLCAAVGMMSLFVGVTNCPVSTMFMAFELFGYEAMPYFVLAVGVSFILSGHASLYHSQRFVASKIRLERFTWEQKGEADENTD